MTKQLKIQVAEPTGVTIFGLVSNVGELKISWSLNQALDIHLTHSESIKMPNSKAGITCEFSYFTYEDEGRLLKYVLLVNRIYPCIYFEEFKNIDYLLFIQGDLEPYSKEKINQLLKNLPEIAALINIPSETIKKKGKLGFI